MTLDPNLLGAAMVAAALLGVIRGIALSQKTVDKEIFANVLVRLANQGQLVRAERLLSAVPKAAYARVIGAGLAAMKQQPAEMPETMVRSAMTDAVLRAREALDPELGRGRAWDAIQAAIALGPAGWAARQGIGLPGWAWAGLAVAILSLVFAIRKRRSIAAIGPDMAAPIIDALLAARQSPPAEGSAYRAPAPSQGDDPATGDFSLQVLRDGRLVASADLALGQVLKLGRLPAAGNAIQLDAPEVSRMHAIIERDSDAITVTDLGAETGTFVNGERVNRARLREGDRVSIGPFELRLARGTATEVPAHEPEPASCSACGKRGLIPLDPLPADWASVGLEADHCPSCGHVALRKSPRVAT